MSWQTFIPAFVLGLASSFHCIGMCGPIALLLPVNKLPARQRTVGVVLYNLGRISTYTVLGILFGFIGRTIYLAGYQQVLSIATGVIIIMGAIGYVFYKRISRNYVSKKIFGYIQRQLQGLLNKKGLATLYVIGILNGFLPCGMVYFAILGSLATGTIASGALFMLLFGVGTLPLMLSLNWFAGLAGMRTRRIIKHIVPYMICIMGLLLVLRGLDLNIPYISPHMEKNNPQIISCH